MKAKEIKCTQGTENKFCRGGLEYDVYVPLSTDESIIIPSNLKGTGFLRNYYEKNQPFLQGVIKRKEFVEIIEGANRICAYVYSYNRKLDVERTKPFVMYSLAIATFLLFVYFLLLFFGIKHKSQDTKVIAYLILGVSVAIALVV